MKRKVHVFMGVGLAVAAAARSLADVIPVALMGAVGSIMPDFDVLYKHRKLLHNVFAALLFTLGALLLMARLGVEGPQAWLYSQAFIVGWLSHILGDMVTKGGVALLWPFSSRRIRALRWRYDDPRVSLLGYMIGICALVFWALRGPLAPLLREALDHAP